ncbi:MAG: SEL1-like repeat protein [Bauldia sp.]
MSADLARAAVWYTKAAEGGVAVAQYRLASLYERGQGVTKDLTNAVNWYQRAADQGNINAMHNLAVLLSEGVDGVPDHDKALQWFLAAGNYGVRDSQYNLGVIYARGLGTGQDLVESYKWFAIAASQGDTDASARRDEVAKAMSADDLAKARAAVAAWHVKAPLVEANAVAAPKGNWDDAPAISVADQQALVAKIQTLLADAGYDPGPADGVIGRKTTDAVRAYQQKAGVPVTGQIDKTLVASLSTARTRLRASCHSREGGNPVSADIASFCAACGYWVPAFAGTTSRR